MIADAPSVSYVLAALAAVVGLIWLVKRLARGRFGLVQGGAGRMRVAEILALDPRRRLHMIECDGQAVLVLTGGPQDLMLGWVPPTEGARR
jgi:flagellar protein FliO/FliZ